MTATLDDTLYARLIEAEGDLIEASQLDDFDDVMNARDRYTLLSVMHEAAQLDSGGSEWTDGPEARAYLAALRKISAHLESVTRGPDSSGAVL